MEEEGSWKAVLPPDRMVSADILKPSDDFCPVITFGTVVGEKPFQLPCKNAFKPAAFLARGNIPLFLQTDLTMFGSAGFSFPNTSSLSPPL